MQLGVNEKKKKKKKEEEEEKYMTHPQAELSLSHMCHVWDSNPHQTQRWDDQIVKRGIENHSPINRIKSLKQSISFSFPP